MNAAVNLALKGLTLTPDKNTADVLRVTRQKAVEIATLIAFQRFLSKADISHGSHQSNPFSDPDSLNIILGGRRCLIHTELVHKREAIRQLRQDPETILGKAVQAAQAPEQLWEEDLLLFAFMGGLLADNPGEIHKAFQARQPLCLLHLLPTHSRSPRYWAPMGSLSIKSDAKRTLHLEIGGQRKDRTLCSERISLPPGEAVRLETEYYSLTYFKAQEPVFERVGLRYRNLPGTYIIQPHQWQNLWVYGMELYLAGYMTWGEFRRKAALAAADEDTYPVDPSGNTPLSLPARVLYPLAPLFKKLRSRNGGSVV
jgi:hypothetical protein